MSNVSFVLVLVLGISLFWGLVFLLSKSNDNKIYFESVDENKHTSTDDRDFTFFAYLVVVILLALIIFSSF
jgi:hypothetical protein